jgi:SAM-dependent methyltransferase
MEENKYDIFYREHGVGVHDDPLRFGAISGLCKGHVLDVACGTGTLADFYFGAYTGLDISAVAIAMARDTRRKDAEFIVSSALDLLALEPRKFDTVVLAEFLEHLDFDTGILDVLLGMTAVGGRWIISVPNGDRVPDADHVRQFTVPELRKKFARYGRVRFHNWAGFSHRILMSVEVGEIAQMELGLVMPVKNEGKGLETAILSCIGFVDHIQIAVDNSSNDDTLAVARRYADVVRPFDWVGSFAAARNLAQADLPTRWALCLDGHEFAREVPDSFTILQEDCDAVGVQIEMEDGFRTWFPRIVRREVEWENEVHNNPRAKKSKLLPGFVIKHDREHLQSLEAVKIRTAQRDEMMRRILGAILKRNPRDVRALFYMQQHSMLNKEFRKAIRYQKKYLRYSTHKQERWTVLFDMALAHLELKHYFRAIWTLHTAEEELPGRWETSELMGAIYAIRGKHGRAIEYLIDSFKEPTTKFIYNPLIRDYVKVWDMIGRCFYALGNYQKALVAFKRAIELEKARPDEKQDKKRLALLESFVNVQA